MRSSRSRLLGVAVLIVAAACGADDEGVAATAASGESGYCDQVAALIGVLDDGGTVGEYNELLAGVAAASPADHTVTWALLLTVSTEPFSYDNFNPAVDSLDRLAPELETACPGLGQIVVDDDGRVRTSASS